MYDNWRYEPASQVAPPTAKDYLSWAKSSCHAAHYDKAQAETLIAIGMMIFDIQDAVVRAIGFWKGRNENNAS